MMPPTPARRARQILKENRGALASLGTIAAAGFAAFTAIASAKSAEVAADQLISAL